MSPVRFVIISVFFAVYYFGVAGCATRNLWNSHPIVSVSEETFDTNQICISNDTDNNKTSSTLIISINKIHLNSNKTVSGIFSQECKHLKITPSEESTQYFCEVIIPELKKHYSKNKENLLLRLDSVKDYRATSEKPNVTSIKLIIFDGNSNKWLLIKSFGCISHPLLVTSR